MSPEPRDLSEALSHEADASSARPIDLDAVLRGSRARRRARRRAVVGATASIAGLLAVGGLVFAVGTMGPRTASSTADGSVAAESGESDAGGAPDSGGAPVAPQVEAQSGEDLPVIAPENLNACGAPIAPATDATTLPLTASVRALAVPVPTGSESTVEVVVANEGAGTVAGMLSAPAITVSDAGTTVWHPRLGTGAASERVAISLAPGESVVLSGVFTAASCLDGGEDALGTSALEPLASGSYGLSAAIAFTPSAGTLEGLIVSPAASVPIG